MSDLTLDETSIHIHELYMSFQRAGFTEEQAFDLIKAMVRGTQGGKSE
jgi:hypothetical protein